MIRPPPKSTPYPTLFPYTTLFTRDGKKVRTIVGLVNHDDISKAIESLL
jgi:hypothetical protein